MVSGGDDPGHRSRRRVTLRSETPVRTTATTDAVLYGVEGGGMKELVKLFLFLLFNFQENT